MVDTYSRLMFEPVLKLPAEYLEADDHYRGVPSAEEAWKPVETGFTWGRPWSTGWFRTRVLLGPEICDRALYLRAQTNAVEALLWVNGRPKGIFNHAAEAPSLGRHHTLFLCEGQAEGGSLDIALECYAGHPIVGTQPFAGADNEPVADPNARFRRTFIGLELVSRRELVKDFVFDLRTLCQLVERLPEASFRRGAIVHGLAAVYEVVPQVPEPGTPEYWLPMLETAREIMRPLLEARNGTSAPRAGLVGHSHMDTAWLWPMDETIRKCARTYSNALSLMEQYPEYRFVQSTPLHAEWMRQYYPDIFQGISRRVREGRWEPNGGMWVECDCNLTSGESMIRQFIKGQAFTRKHFDYQADTFWLPDTFGYSAAIPQIMLGCGIRNFLTTKLTWNETNTFPYDTFWWYGLDGSRVLTHFNDIHCWPDPATLINKVEGGGPKDFRSVENYVQHKDANDRRLISYGFGDGGGGPQFEMLEMARRCVDLEGCPRAEHTSVSQFMRDLERTARQIPDYHGELYFEGHRGTLTQMAGIKRGNRKGELALRDVEFFTVLEELHGAGTVGRHKEITRLWDLLLINQFHDILPGTSIPEVHDRALRELAEVQEGASALASELLGPPGAELTVWNTLNWVRRGTLEIPDPGTDLVPLNPQVTSQRFVNLAGEARLLLAGLEIPGLGAQALTLVPGDTAACESAFHWDGTQLRTPRLQASFDEAGRINSLIDLEQRREIRGEGLPLNTFLCGEDVPESWDNWNIDADQKRKLRPQLELLTREVVADGALQFRLRSSYAIGKRSILRQDMIFSADALRIDFETEVDWRERHQLLKVAFPLNVAASTARQEIQFGHIERPTRVRNSHEAAMFEVCNHKWTDISESRYGVALVNDCKYGISVEGTEMRLSLLRSGCRPDPRADNGLHRFTYSLLPHTGGFSVESVVRPAYELNVPLQVGRPLDVLPAPLLELDSTQIIVESIKPAEDCEGCIVRLYEAERGSVEVTLRFPIPPRRVIRTNMLEEALDELPLTEGSTLLRFRAFEIITLRLIP